MNVRTTIAGAAIIIIAALGTGILAQGLAVAGRGASSERFNVTELSVQPPPTIQAPITLQPLTTKP
jgi:hypothetical protein